MRSDRFDRLGRLGQVGLAFLLPTKLPQDIAEGSLPQPSLAWRPDLLGEVDRRLDHARALVSYVPDQPFLYEKLTGREFLQFTADLYAMPPGRAAEKILPWTKSSTALVSRSLSSAATLARFSAAAASRAFSFSAWAAC